MTSVSAVAAAVANSVAKNYIKQNLEYKFTASQEATSWHPAAVARQSTNRTPWAPQARRPNAISSPRPRVAAIACSRSAVSLSAPIRFDAWRVGDQRYYVSDTQAFQRETG